MGHPGDNARKYHAKGKCPIPCFYFIDHASHDNVNVQFTELGECLCVRDHEGCVLGDDHPIDE